MKHPAFLSPPGSHLIRTSSRSIAQLCARRPAKRAVQMSTTNPEPKKLNLLQLAAIAVGGIFGAFCDMLPINRAQLSAPPVHAAQVDVEPGGAIPLQALGIKRDDYVGERELRRRKTTQYSEAEQEIMELEEWEVATQWFRDLQLVWAGVASIGGIFVLYKGGVMWENWIKEQEKKDMEEEIKLTGTFIDPRAVRKDEDEGKQGKNNGGKGDQGGGQKNGGSGNNPKQGPPDVDSLEKLFGKS